MEITDPLHAYLPFLPAVKSSQPRSLYTRFIEIVATKIETYFHLSASSLKKIAVCVADNATKRAKTDIVSTFWKILSTETDNITIKH